MNSTNKHINTNNVLFSDRILTGSQEKSNYLWNNLVIEKRNATSVFNRFYKGSLVDAFWTVFSSKLSDSQA
jgi:hypothetical protein